MSADPTARRGLMRHPMAKWAILLAVLFALWFGGWFLVASLLNRGLGEAFAKVEAEQKIAITCDGRDVVGFPFRMGLACERTGLATPEGARFTAGSLRSAAQIYDLTRHVVELGSPATIEGPQGTVEAQWQTLRLFADGTTQGGYERISLTSDAPSVRTGATAIAARSLELHTRPVNDAAGAPTHLDLALRTTRLQLPAPAGSAQPDPFDIVLQAQLDFGYAAMVEGGRSFEEWAKAGGRILLQDVRLMMGETGTLSFAGPLTIEDDGTLSGKVKVGVEGADDIAAFAASLDPTLRDQVGSLMQAVAAMGQPTSFASGERPAVEVTLERGAMRLGILPLGRIPPVVGG